MDAVCDSRSMFFDTLDMFRSALDFKVDGRQMDD